MLLLWIVMKKPSGQLCRVLVVYLMCLRQQTARLRLDSTQWGWRHPSTLILIIHLITHPQHTFREKETPVRDMVQSFTWNPIRQIERHCRPKAASRKRMTGFRVVMKRLSASPCWGRGVSVGSLSPRAIPAEKPNQVSWWLVGCGEAVCDTTGRSRPAS